MRFGSVPIAEAEGAILAHSQSLGGQRLRKGRILEAGDIAALAAAGHTEVIVARLTEGDLHEDAAATRVAEAIVGETPQGLSFRSASTGRVNVYAEAPGVLGLNTDAVEALNRVDPMITLATLPPLARTQPKGMVATVKIISYAVSEASVETAVAAGTNAIWLHPVQLQTASLIETDVGAGPGKGRDAIESRLTSLGMRLSNTTLVRHAQDEIAAAIKEATGDLVLLLTASATSDPDDVAPSALRAAGGTVARFGMPVDPGNLLFIGDLAGKPVIGLPGCARSPALNGADWVLERTVCGLPPGDKEIAAMGVGGLLKESPARPHPRERR